MALLRELLQQTQETLTSAGIPEPRLEAEVMIMNMVRVPRHRIYAFQEEEMPPETEEVLAQVVERRLKREPLAYILGHKEFYGVDLVVRPQVMIPRPETEVLVEQALFMGLTRMETGGLVIAEVGVGCGAISVVLAIHLPAARIFATDLYPGALDVAQFNVRRHNVADRVTLLQGDLLEPLPEPADIILANLPYVRSDAIQHLQPEVQQEPREALDGGADGLAVIRRLMEQAPAKLKEGGAILLEVDPEQVGPLREEAERLFPGATIATEQDLAHMDRVFVVDTGPGGVHLTRASEDDPLLRSEEGDRAQ